jgi:VIT1/CCC1 family predicted Fe2+/Mn2+ transporter
LAFEIPAVSPLASPELARLRRNREVGTHEADARHVSVASAGDVATAAAVSFLLFALGAALPVLPFCILPVGRMFAALAGAGG